MRSPAQPSLFGDTEPRQPGLFDAAFAEAPEPVISRGPPRTREEHHAAMLETLEFLRGCTECPWDSYQVRVNAGIFRLRSEWFPPEVADPLMAAFAAEAERLDLASAPAPEDDWA